MSSVPDQPVSVAIETTCRAGGVALGIGDTLQEAIAFDARRRHATLLIGRLEQLLAARKLSPADVAELYVSVGPGSFTGIRVGVTVARTWAQACPALRTVAVPTPLAVAQNAAHADWRHLGVILDAKEELVHATLLIRNEHGRPVPASPPRTEPLADFLARAPRPLVLSGEGLGYHSPGENAEGIGLLNESLWLPTPQGVWAAGRQLANAGEYTEYHHLLPHYARKPEAVRLWEKRQRPGPDQD